MQKCFKEGRRGSLLAINRKASSEVKNDKRGEKIEELQWNREKNHKDTEKKYREWGFPVESGKPSVPQPQAEWWMSAAPGNVSNLPLKLGALKVGRGKGRPASCWASGGTNRDPLRKDRSK